MGVCLPQHITPMCSGNDYSFVTAVQILLLLQGEFKLTLKQTSKEISIRTRKHLGVLPNLYIISGMISNTEIIKVWLRLHQKTRKQYIKNKSQYSIRAYWGGKHVAFVISWGITGSKLTAVKTGYNKNSIKSSRHLKGLCDSFELRIQLLCRKALLPVGLWSFLYPGNSE